MRRTCKFTLEVTFEDEDTSPQQLAYAIDRILEKTDGFDDYGEIEVGPCLIQLEPRPPVEVDICEGCGSDIPRHLEGKARDIYHESGCSEREDR